jgi:crossover junction endodeoxyribonuclease RuvC
MRWLGIDPSLAATGWGLIEVDGPRLRHIDHGVIKTKPSTPIQERLYFIRIEIETIMGRLSVGDAIAFEETHFAMAKGGMSAIALARAQGAILSATGRYVTTVEIMTPTQWRKSLGIGGNGTKEAAGIAVRTLLGLDEVPTPHDAAEGLGIAIAGSTRR